MTDLDKTQILKVITPMGNQKPAIHKTCIFLDLLSEEIFREGMLQISEISFKTRQTMIFNGIIVVMPVFDIIPFAIFRMISVPAPGSGFICFADKTADETDKRTTEDGFDKPLPVVTLMDEFGGRLELPREAVKSSIEHSLDELCDMIGKTIRDAADMTGPRSQIYLTGGGIAMMKGGREYLSQKLERPVRMPAPRTNRLSNPNYTSVLGMLDLVFDALEERTPQDESLPGKLVNSVKNMFGRK